MASTAFLMDTDTLVQALSQETRSERMEQRVKPTMKQAIEFAATLSGTDTSEFVSTAAFQVAVQKINAMHHMHLSGDDAERFFAALERKRGPNEAMKKLMTDYKGMVEDDD